MRILYLVPDFKIGGVTTVVQSIDAGMRANGYNSKIICLKELDSANFENLKMNSKFDLIKALYRLRKIVSEYKPDIIHSHTIYSHIMALLYKILFNKNMVIINTEHGSFVDSQNNELIFKIYKFLSSYASKITFVSNFSATTYLENKIVLQDKVIVIYNGIDPQEDIIDKYNIIELKNEFKFCYVGRFSQEKNVILLIKAFEKLQEEKTVKDVSLYLIGDGEEDIFLKNYCSKNNIKNINFLGFRKDVVKILNLMDCIILSSLTEGLPMVILEAYANKVLAVSTDCGGVKEIITDMNFIAKNNDLFSLLETMKYIMSLDIQSKERIKADNYNYYKGKFSSNIMVKSYENLYKEVLNDR